MTGKSEWLQDKNADPVSALGWNGDFWMEVSSNFVRIVFFQK